MVMIDSKNCCPQSLPTLFHASPFNRVVLTVLGEIDFLALLAVAWQIHPPVSLTSFLNSAFSLLLFWDFFVVGVIISMFQEVTSIHT
jgi:hypothetical protein